MELQIKIMTHESIIHSQIQSIERVLARPVSYGVILNVRGVKSHIHFQATPEEIELVKADLGYRVYVKKDNEWVADPI